MTCTLPLTLLKRVVIRAETRLTSSVLGALPEIGGAMVIFSGRQGRRLAIVQGRAHNDARIRLAQYAKSLDPAWRLSSSNRFIGAKLARQQRFLERALAARVGIAENQSATPFAHFGRCASA